MCKQTLSYNTESRIYLFSVLKLKCKQVLTWKECQGFAERVKDSDSFSRAMKNEAQFSNYISHDHKRAALFRLEFMSLEKYI